MTGSEAKTISLRLPRFKFDFRISARLLLGELGMIDAFSDEADFSGMDGTPGLSIADVLQKAFISVDEQGTEAAAATAVISGTPSVPVIEEQLTFDRPFLFEIRERTTGTVLFAGRVMNPAK
jgi:serpin B